MAGVFLGLCGVVIKEPRGGTSTQERALRLAVDVDYDTVRHDLLTKINETLHRDNVASPANSTGVREMVQ